MQQHIISVSCFCEEKKGLIKCVQNNSVCSRLTKGRKLFWQTTFRMLTVVFGSGLTTVSTTVTHSALHSHELKTSALQEDSAMLTVDGLFCTF